MAKPGYDFPAPWVPQCVFNKHKSDTLPSHRPYDLKIDLEDGATPLIGLMYSLSQSELATLRDFIDEHLHIGFI